MTEEKKKSFLLYLDSLNVLDDLTDEEAGKIFKAIRSYESDGTYILEGLLNAVFTPFKTMLDNNEEKYQAVLERNKQNGMKGGRPKKDISEEETQENPKNPVGFSKTQPNPKKHDNDNVNDNDIYNNKLIKFKKPTIKEIEDYCLERNNSIDARYFYDYYESKGWLIGKTKMKDFKAAIRMWEQNKKKFEIQKQKEKEEQEFFDYENTPYRAF